MIRAAPVSLEAFAQKWSASSLMKMAHKFSVTLPDGSVDTRLIDLPSIFQAMALHCALTKEQAAILLKAWETAGWVELINSHGIKFLRLPKVTL